MIRVLHDRPPRACGGWTRRDLLRAGTLGWLSARYGCPVRTGAAAPARSIIFLMMVGAPSSIDTFDPKPTAPLAIRGPYRAIRVRGSEALVTECFPRLARRGDRIAFVRAMHHSAAPIHETGQQLLQTGRLCNEREYPHFGAVAASLLGGTLPWALLPGPIRDTGVDASHGQSPLPGGPPPIRWEDAAGAALIAGRPLREQADALARAAEHAPTPPLVADSAVRAALDLAAEPERIRDAYGRHRFGQCCLLARRLVERGVPCVTVNMFDTVFGEVTWDTHGSAPFHPITAIGETLAPQFDRAYAALLDDLAERGLLDTTLVVATGEMGRSPAINPAGGRDHWPRAWTALLAGGGVRGGRAIGATDPLGGEPIERPVSPAELVATLYSALGIPLDLRLPGPDGEAIPLVPAGTQPVAELF